MSKLIKTYAAGAIVNPCRLLKMGAADYAVIQATDGSAPFVGVSSENLIAASGQSVDVSKDEIALVELGNTVTRGQYLTADANGKAIPVTIVAGTPVYFAGKAEISGVAGDIIPMHIAPGVVGNDSGIVSADVTVTTGQLLALNATPKSLVAAPGANKILLMEDLQLYLAWNSAAYAGIAAGEDLEVRYTDGSGQLVATIETTGFLDAVANAIRSVRPTTTAAIVPVENAALVLRLASGEIITGNSPLKARIRYRSVDMTW